MPHLSADTVFTIPRSKRLAPPTHVKLCSGVFVLTGVCFMSHCWQPSVSSVQPAYTPAPPCPSLPLHTSNTHSGVVSRHGSLELLPALAPSSEPSAESIAEAGTIGRVFDVSPPVPCEVLIQGFRYRRRKRADTPSLLTLQTALLFVVDQVCLRWVIRKENKPAHFSE